MIGDVIDTFRNTTPAVNQKFVPKIQIQTSNSQGQLICQSRLFRLYQFSAQCLRNLHRKQRGNE